MLTVLLDLGRMQGRFSARFPNRTLLLPGEGGTVPGLLPGPTSPSLGRAPGNPLITPGDVAPSRPDFDVVLVPAGTAGSIPAEVALVELLGAHAHLHLDAGPHRLVAVVSGAGAPAAGTAVHLRLDPARAHRFDAEGRAVDN